jgi:hypothetical protein
MLHLCLAKKKGDNMKVECEVCKSIGYPVLLHGDTRCENCLSRRVYEFEPTIELPKLTLNVPKVKFKKASTCCKAKVTTDLFKFTYCSECLNRCMVSLVEPSSKYIGIDTQSLLKSMKDTMIKDIDKTVDKVILKALSVKQLYDIMDQVSSELKFRVGNKC